MDYDKFFEGQEKILALLCFVCIIVLVVVNVLFPNRQKCYGGSYELMFWDEPNPHILDEFSVNANAYSERYGFTRSDLTVRQAEGEDGLIWTWWDLVDVNGNSVQYHYCDSIVVYGYINELPIYDVYVYGDCLYRFSPTIDEAGRFDYHYGSGLFSYDVEPTPYIPHE